MKIKCQHPKGQVGCSHCGGRGWIIQSYKSKCCKRTIWDRSWPMTSYVGKTYTTFNGVTMTVVSSTKHVCSNCVTDKVAK